MINILQVLENGAVVWEVLLSTLSSFESPILNIIPNLNCRLPPIMLRHADLYFPRTDRLISTTESEFLSIKRVFHWDSLLAESNFLTLLSVTFPVEYNWQVK